MKRFFQHLFNWENWSYDAIYAPVSIAWLYYSIKARAFWFFTPVNPSLIFAGFEGGSKKEMYSQLPKWCLPKTLFIDNKDTLGNIKEQLNNAGLNYPFVAKPDTGMQGVLFRIISTDDKLAEYHRKVGEPYILQSFVQLPMEFSVFHIRYPGETKGIITGLVAKDYLHVTGDGKKTLAELIDLHPLAKHKKEELERRHGEKWNHVPAANENYVLNYAGNHRHGAKFINLNKEIDQRLCDVFDKISNEAGQFYFGRYDLKCTSLEDLKNGKNIEVLEYNGAGAATIHIFDCNMSYWQALKEIVRHWDHLYKIGKINNGLGVRYWGLREGSKFMGQAKKNYKRLLEIEATVT